MEHARDAEEAEVSIELVRRCVRCVREVVVEALGVEAGDLVVLTAVVGDQFAASLLECGEVGWPCSDVGRVESFGYGGVVDVEGRWVP